MSTKYNYKSLPRQDKACRDECPGWAVYWEYDTHPGAIPGGARTKGLMVIYSPTKESARSEFEDMQFRLLQEIRNIRVTDVRPH